MSVDFTEWCGDMVGTSELVALCGIQFVFREVVVVPCQQYRVINIISAHIDSSIVASETYPVPGRRRNM